MLSPSEKLSPFLLEVGFEELPHEHLELLVRSMIWGIKDVISSYRWSPDLEEFRWVVTPRRIGMITPLVEKFLVPQSIVKHGPVFASAVVDGMWTQSAIGFFKGLGISSGISPHTLPQLSNKEVQEIQQGIISPPASGFISPRKDGMLCITCAQQCDPVSLGGIFTQFLQKLLEQKDFTQMQWTGSPQEFIRPVRWILALHGDTVVDISFCGVNSSNQTYPHRLYFPQSDRKSVSTETDQKFYGNQPVKISAVDMYQPCLRSVGVYPSIFSFTQDRHGHMQIHQRWGLCGGPSREQIYREFIKNSPHPHVDPFQKDPQYLWVEVETLTEGFSLFFCQLEIPIGSSTSLPEEVCMSELYIRQRMIPVDYAVHLGNFRINAIVIGDVPYGSSITLKKVEDGYRRVLTARFVELQSLYDEDCNNSQAMIEKLCTLVYKEKLGTYGERFDRIRDILSGKEGANRICQETVGELVTYMYVDVVSNIVSEFPDLQGKMSKYYVAKGVQDVGIFAESTDLLVQKKSSESRYILCKFLRFFSQYWDKTENILSHFTVGLSPTPYSDPHRIKQEADDLIEACFSLASHLSLDFDNSVSKVVDPVAIKTLIQDILSDPGEDLCFSIPVDQLGKRRLLPVSPQVCEQTFTFLLQRLRYQVEQRVHFLTEKFVKGVHDFACCDAVVTADQDDQRYLKYSPYEKLNYFDVIFRMYELSKMFTHHQSDDGIQLLADQIKRIKKITRDFVYTEEKSLHEFIYLSKDDKLTDRQSIEHILKKTVQDAHPLIVNFVDNFFFTDRLHGESYNFCDRREKSLRDYIYGNSQSNDFVRRGFISLVQEIFETVVINDTDAPTRAANMSGLILAAYRLSKIANWELLASHIKKGIVTK